MFGSSFFGKAYFGGAYWAPNGTASDIVLIAFRSPGRAVCSHSVNTLWIRPFATSTDSTRTDFSFSLN